MRLAVPQASLGAAPDYEEGQHSGHQMYFEPSVALLVVVMRAAQPHGGRYRYLPCHLQLPPLTKSMPSLMPRRVSRRHPGRVNCPVAWRRVHEVMYAWRPRGRFPLKRRGCELLAWMQMLALAKHAGERSRVTYLETSPGLHNPHPAVCIVRCSPANA